MNSGTMKHKTNSPARRSFVKTCLAAVAAVASNPAMMVRSEPLRRYHRVLLVDNQGEPVRSASLSRGDAFIFHYPHITTPCFLVDIGRSLDAGRELATEDGQRYHWQGGSGPGASVVAFSAICAHKLSYPTRTVSFLNFRPEPTRFMDGNQQVRERSQIIYCCSERSVYDPTRGAEVIGGPARQPLTTVDLEYDEANDRYFAVGTRGGELYEEFFTRFGFNLALVNQIDDVRALVEHTTEVIPHDAYSSQPVTC